MRAKRAAEIVFRIPACRNPARRRKAERDIQFALRTYFPHRCYNDFTEDQREMIRAIVHAAKFGGDQSLAASRGDGKGTLAECVIAICICCGILRFPLLVSATGPEANQMLANIKQEFETNDLLHYDFPEVCEPIRQLDGAPQRAGRQTVEYGTDDDEDQERTRIQWSGDRVVFPMVRGSKASGAVLMTRGLDGAMRGIRHGSKRPDFVLIDDPDTDESAVSPSQQEKRMKTIDKTIGGMAGPGQKMGRVILCTCINRTCIAYQYTDPKARPSWRGRRFKFLQQPPTNEDSWAQYVQLRQDGFDPNSKVEIEDASKFYVAHRAKMDAGAVVSNPHRWSKDAFPPEYSALQHYYNEIADKGLAFVQTELQNDPPEEEGPLSSGITPAIVAGRLSGIPMNIVPPNPISVTAFVDVGQSKGCHYAAVAWYPGARGVVFDYGVQEVNLVAGAAPAIAVKRALRAWREDRLQRPYVNQDGEPVKLDLVLVDSGDGQLEGAVYEFVKEAGAPFRASKGFGSTYGHSPFRAVQKRSPDRRPGNHWYEQKQPSGIWLVGLDVDHWKEWVHDRFMTQHRDEFGNPRPGSISLFGDDERRHHAFSHHIVAEVQETEFVRGKGVIRKWKVRNRNNDWLDVMAGASAAGAMMGATLLSDGKAEVRPLAGAPLKVVSLAEWFAGNGKKRRS